MKDNRWTTPGGEINPNESHTDQLREIVEKEVGVYPICIDESPFFVKEIGPRHQPIILYGYMMELYFPDNIPLFVPYIFADGKNLYNARVTNTLKQITGSYRFKKLAVRKKLDARVAV
jgi:ADP-ribose pyrophosphatase YjhB (NUDIX family)